MNKPIPKPEKKVTRDILIEELNGVLWVAAVENNKFEAIDLDPQVEDVRWGSLYWAKVTKIDNYLNAAFVDLDGEAVGLLHAKDVWLEDDNGEWSANKGKRIGQVVKGGDMLILQVKDAQLASAPLDNDDLPSEAKASKVSMDISLQGRFMIHTPLVKGNRISARINDKKTRDTLSVMMDNLKDTNGLILRASAAHCQTEVLIREGQILQKLWSDLQTFERDDEAGLIWAGPDAIHRVLANQASQQIRHIEVSTMENFGRVEAWALEYAPDLVTKVKAADPPSNVAKLRSGEPNYEDLGLFDWYDLVDQLNALFMEYVIMNNGAVIIIQETALGTTIDINTGGAKSSARVNYDAMGEIARQIRLRNLGGMIIIDPAGIIKGKDKKDLEKALKTAIAKDPVTVACHGFTKMGLIECSRARRAPSLNDRIRALQ